MEHASNSIGGYRQSRGCATTLVEDSLRHLRITATAFMGVDPHRYSDRMETPRLPFLARKAVRAEGDVVGMTIITMTKETYDDELPDRRPDLHVERVSTGTLLTKAQETTDDDFSDGFAPETPSPGTHRPFLANFAKRVPGSSSGGTVTTEARGETTDDREP